jgi:diguanylate cyclase (GGDEF)-like protein
VHTVLAFHFKPQFINALHDASNGLSVAILGCYLGNRMVRIRLDSYEAHRLLTIQKETDVLTGLSSRRKLFETLAALETADAPKPTGVLMVDIDHFKELNDSYGHAAGDRCLGQFGEVLQAFSHSHRLHFYRYGGEEFVAMAYGYDRQELLFIADRLRLAVQAMQMHEHPITVSIGVAYCGDEQVDNYEKVIHRADNVLYKAKHTGRNRVYMEQQGRMGAQKRAL